jgi:xylulokinase
VGGVAGGAGDNAAAACGMGAVQEGQGFVSLGTSGVLLVARDQLQAAPETSLHSFCHAVPDRWYQMSVMLAAADSLTWLGSVTGQSAAALTNALGTGLRAPGSVGFAPYLSGERTPHNDAHVRGGFSGLATTTSVQDMTHAVLEGVCFGLRDGAEAMAQTGAEVEMLYAIGGGAASRYWLQMLATVLDTPLHLPSGRAFGAALGAARLGMMAATGAPLEEVMIPPETAEIIMPDKKLLAAYDKAYAKFRTFYPAFSALA